MCRCLRRVLVSGSSRYYTDGMKKVIVPILLFLVAILLLAGAAYWYEQKYGSEGPFPPHGHN